jgi:3-hydroxyacyl-CoA dehydrogenase / enoyl-CoA hydratase / 3-hydroxybutyryl-CoA epimerase
MSDTDTSIFRLERSGTLAVLVFDMPASRVNLLSQAALAELERVADWLPASGLSGLVLRSAKVAGFCAGADLAEIASITPRGGVFPSRTQLRNHFAPFTRTFRKIETAGVPVVSVVDGAVMGGGLELALASHARIVTDRPETRLSLPEFSVGLFPAGGGSQRLPRLIGLDAALPILTSERTLSAAEAVQIGLAQRSVAAEHAVSAAMDWLSNRPDARQLWDRGFVYAAGQVDAARIGEGPAAAALARCLSQGLANDLNTGNRIELEALVDLLSRIEPWAIMRLRFQGQRTWLMKQREGGQGPIEAVLSAVAAVAAAPWDEARCQLAVAAAECAAAGLTLDERAAADFLIVRDLGFPKAFGGPLARAEGLWPSGA